MMKVKKAQKGGCLSTTGSGTRTSIYKSAAGEGSSGGNGKAARQFARAERKMDKAQAKLDREEAAAKAKAPKAKHGMKVKKAQSGKMVPSEMKPGKMIKKADRDARADSMAKSLDKVSPFGKKKVAPKKKMKHGGTVSMQLGSYDRQLGKNYTGKATVNKGAKAKMGKSVGKCKYGC